MSLKTFFASFSRARAALAAFAYLRAALAVLACMAALSSNGDSAFIAEVWFQTPEAVTASLQQRPDLLDTDVAELVLIAAGRTQNPTTAISQLDQLIASTTSQQVIGWAQSARCGVGVIQGSQSLLAACDVAHSMATDLADPYLLVLAGSNEAAMFYHQGNFRDAALRCRAVLMQLKELHWPIVQGSITNNFGLALRAQGLHREALEQFALGLENVVDNQRNLLETLRFNVGVSSMDLGLFEEAASYMDEVLATPAVQDNPRQILVARTYRGMLELRQGRPAAVLPFLVPVVDDPAFNSFPAQLGHALGVFGEALFQLGRRDEAIGYYDRAFELTRSVVGVFEARHVKLHFARVQRLLGNLATAEQNLVELIDELRSAGAGEMLVRAYDELSKLRQAQGDPNAAFDAVGQLRAAEAQSREQRFETQLALVRADIDLDRAEQEVALLRQQQATIDTQQRLDRLLLYGAIVMAVLLALLVYLVLSRRFEQRQRLADADAKHALQREVAERSAELEAASRARIEAIAEREALKTRIAEDDKLRVLGQLTGGVAHDFNNLLTVIGGSAELLQNRLAQREDDSAQLLANISKAVESGSGITRSLRMYARQQPMDLKPIALGRFLRDSLPLLRRTVGDAIDVRADLPTEDVIVRLDPSQLTTALLNLCLNSADAIAVDGEAVSGELDLALGFDEERAWITVSDSGAGMTAEIAAHAIEPFYSTKDESEHGGLGLSMVYGFAKQLGGELRIDSEVGRGTDIWLSLPRADVEARATDAIGAADGSCFESDIIKHDRGVR